MGWRPDWWSTAIETKTPARIFKRWSQRARRMCASFGGSSIRLNPKAGPRSRMRSAGPLPSPRGGPHRCAFHHPFGPAWNPTHRIRASLCHGLCRDHHPAPEPATSLPNRLSSTHPRPAQRHHGGHICANRWMGVQNYAKPPPARVERKVLCYSKKCHRCQTLTTEVKSWRR